MTTDQPRRASSTALAAPMPDDAPVMMATFMAGEPIADARARGQAELAKLRDAHQQLLG